MLCYYNSKVVYNNKMVKPGKDYIFYCPDGHGEFPVSKFYNGIPKCPVCDKVLRKMEGVVQK